MTTIADRHWRIGCALVIGVALALRLAYVFAVVGDDPLAGDAIYYSAQAEMITQGEGFTHPVTHEPAADHPPATAVLLALPSLGGGDPRFEQRLFMALLGVGTVTAVLALAHEVGGRRTALVAGAAAAVYPGLWINDGLVMSETPTALLTALLLLVAIRWRRGAAPAWVLGLVGGLAMLTRAELGLLLALVAVPWGLAGPWRTRLRRVGAVALFAALVLTPWTVRNLIRFEEPVLISTNDGLTLIGSNCDPAYGEGIGFWHLRCAPPVPGDQSEVAAEYRRQALQYVGDHLDELPKVIAARLGRAWGVYRPTDQVYLNQGEGRPLLASRMAMVAWLALAPVAVAGAVILHRRRGPWWVLVAPAITVTITVALTYGIARFRLPAEVAALVLAAVAVDALVARVSRTGATVDRAADAAPPAAVHA